jgi:MoaA/NifB/PqqE/SkfB family radical SAM enzyme
MKIVSRPVLCNYYVTYRCNARCPFCDIWEKPSPYVNPTNLQANLTDLKRLGVKIIDFTGGEPLLHRRIDHFFGLAKRMGFITTLTTNCLLYPKYAEKLKGNVSMLHFSVDSADRDRHNASRGVPCYDFVKESIAIAVKLGERPDILFTVTDENIHEIPAVYDTFCKNDNLILILNPVFSYNHVGGELSQKNLKILSDWGYKKNIYLNQAFIRLRRQGGNDPLHPVCKAASTTIVISPENELMLPCYHLGLESFPIDNQLFNLWHSPQIQQLIRMEGKYEACKGCTINCYMNPSFATELNRYFFYALPSTLKYAYEKKMFAF